MVGKSDCDDADVSGLASIQEYPFAKTANGVLWGILFVIQMSKRDY